MIKIALFTGNRSEYGLMRSLINLLNNDNFFELHVLVSSSHIDKKLGYTLKEIEADGIAGSDSSRTAPARRPSSS